MDELQNDTQEQTVVETTTENQEEVKPEPIISTEMALNVLARRYHELRKNKPVTSANKETE